MAAGLIASADWLADRDGLLEGQGPVSYPGDKRIAELLMAWMALDPAAREAEARGIQLEQRVALLGYASRMATLAVRQFDEGLVLLGLAALVLESGHFDYRDNLMALAPLYDAAIRVEGSADDYSSSRPNWRRPILKRTQRSFCRDR